MDFISIIPDAYAWIVSGGVYRQVPLAVRGNRVFAKHGGGWVRLSAQHHTSHPKIRWHEIDPGQGDFELVASEVRFVPGPEQMKAIEGPEA